MRVNVGHVFANGQQISGPHKNIAYSLFKSDVGPKMDCIYYWKKHKDIIGYEYCDIILPDCTLLFKY